MWEGIEIEDPEAIMRALADDGPLTWMRYDVFSGRADGQPGAEIRCSTNDDNDDGFPDGDIAEWTLKFDTVEEALKHAGKTRRGFYGQPVTVTLDGEPHPKEGQR